MDSQGTLPPEEPAFSPTILAELSADERVLLQTREVASLTRRQQLEYLESNRRVGFWVTAIAAGFRLLLLGLGGFGAIAWAVSFASARDMKVRVFAVGLGVVVVGWTLWQTSALKVRLRELGRRRPAIENALERLGKNGERTQETSR